MCLRPVLRGSADFFPLGTAAGMYFSREQTKLYFFLTEEILAQCPACDDALDTGSVNMDALIHNHSVGGGTDECRRSKIHHGEKTESNK